MCDLYGGRLSVKEGAYEYQEMVRDSDNVLRSACAV